MTTRTTNGRTSRRTIIGAAAAMALALAACGGDEADDLAGDAADQVDDAIDDGQFDDVDADDVRDEVDEQIDDAVEEAADAIGAETGDGESFARVTLDGETYEFEQTSACIGMGGAVGGGFHRDNYTEEFRFDLPPQDWEDQNQSGQSWPAPSVQLLLAEQSIGTAETYHPESVQDAAVVTSFAVDGTSASGTAEVVDLDAVAAGTDDGAAAETRTLEFELSC